MKVLLAVSHDGVRKSLADCLRNSGENEIEAVGCAADVLDLLDEGRQFDALLVFLTDGFGFTLLQLLKLSSRDRTLPVVMIYDPTGKEEIEQLGGIPADEYDLPDSVFTALEAIARRPPATT